MSNFLTAVSKVVEIAEHHGIDLEDFDEPAAAIEHVLQVVRERSRLAKTDMRTLEALAVDIADHQATTHDRHHPHNGADQSATPTGTE